MTSKTTLIGSTDQPPLYQLSSQGEPFSTSIGERSAKSLNAKSKCAIVAFAIAGIGGIVIVGLGASNLLGPIGNTGFIGSLSGGGVLALISAAGIAWIAIGSCKSHLKQANALIEKRDNTTTVKSIGKEKFGTSSKAQSSYPYSKPCQAAIDFANQKLSENPDTQPQVLSAGSSSYQPVNQKIALLTTLFLDGKNTFLKEIETNKNDPWPQEKVINAADSLMKISYAISCLTLEDLQKFTEGLTLKGVNRTFVQALTKQDSYQYRSYYFCTEVYHLIRGGVTWMKNPYQENEEGFFYPAKTSEDHANLFYKIDTIQSSWRVLYNDYCDRVRLYVIEEDLVKADSRHSNWTKKDIEEETFYHTPDTRPT